MNFIKVLMAILFSEFTFKNFQYLILWHLQPQTDKYPFYQFYQSGKGNSGSKDQFVSRSFRNRIAAQLDR